MYSYAQRLSIVKACASPFLEPKNMDENKETFVITLPIGNTPQRFAVPRSKEEDYRAAAKLVNETFNTYRQRFLAQTEERYNAAVLLDLAMKIIQLEKSNDKAPIIEVLNQLSAELKEVLG